MIGIITVNSDTFTNPLLYSIVKRANEKGMAVALFCGYQEAKIPEELTATRYFTAPKTIILPRRPANLVRYFARFLKTVIELKKQGIRHVIAVDPAGLILAGRIKQLYRGLHIHYCSFEIFFRQEITGSTYFQWLKALEIHFAKKISSVIIQDEGRKKALAQETAIHLPANRWYLMPVALADPSLSHGVRSKTAFGFSDTDIVYLHTGSVDEWSGIGLVIAALEAGLPPDTYFFIHNRSPFEPGHPVHQKLFALRDAGYPLVLHDEYFDDFAAYCDFLHCFDYGLVCYTPMEGAYTGNNLRQIGLASGKFSYYMMSGLPSLLSPLGMYPDILEKYAVGKLVEDAAALSQAVKNHTLAAIRKDDCRAFYQEVLNPDLEITRFLNEMINEN